MKTIFTKNATIKGNSSEEFVQLRKALQHSFNEVRSEMDDHLGAINQNTSEIQAIHSFVAEFDSKLEKLTERVDKLFMMLAPDQSIDFSSIKLSRQEQEVFTVLYSIEEPLTPEQVGKKLGLSKQLAGQFLYNLQLKGIPMIVKNWSGELFYALDKTFKDLQARKSVLKVSDSVKKYIAQTI